MPPPGAADRPRGGEPGPFSRRRGERRVAAVVVEQVVAAGQAVKDAVLVWYEVGSSCSSSMADIIPEG